MQIIIQLADDKTVKGVLWPAQLNNRLVQKLLLEEAEKVVREESGHMSG